MPLCEEKKMVNQKFKEQVINFCPLAKFECTSEFRLNIPLIPFHSEALCCQHVRDPSSVESLVIVSWSSSVAFFSPISHQQSVRLRLKWVYLCCVNSYSYLQKYAGEHTVNNREECWKPLIYYRASLQATAEGDDTVSFISSDSNRPSLSSQSRCPSVRQTASEGTLSFQTVTVRCGCAVTDTAFVLFALL